MSIYAHVYKSLAYDPIVDFQPISQVATFDFAIAVGPAGAGQVAQGAGRLGEGQPGQGSYGTPAAGTLPHFFAVQFATRRRARSAPRRLPRIGRGADRSRRRADPDRGHHHQRCARAAQGRPHPRAGDVRRGPLAVPAGPADLQGSRLRHSRARGWYGVFAPAKTPPDMVERLNKAIVAAVQAPAVKERLLAFGLHADRHVRGRAGAGSSRPIPSCGRRPSRPRASRRSSEARVGHDHDQHQGVTRDAIAATYERIAPHIRQTPVLAVEGAGLRPRRRRLDA